MSLTMEMFDQQYHLQYLLTNVVLILPDTETDKNALKRILFITNNRLFAYSETFEDYYYYSVSDSDTGMYIGMYSNIIGIGHFV